MKFVIAPDSFKGCMTAKQACAAIRDGLLRVFPDVLTAACFLPAVPGQLPALSPAESADGHSRRFPLQSSPGLLPGH